MIVAGIDIGSLSGKAVIMDVNTIASWSIIPTSADSTYTAMQVMGKALKQGGLSFKDIDYVVSTGYGRVNVPFAHRHITEISCHTKSAIWFCPEARTILDMGGQDCKAIRCDEKGNVMNFVMNDKCAAGTGRYLERVAAMLELPLEEIGPLSLKPIGEPATISSFCAVFAEKDILLLVRKGRHVNDILAGACMSITEKIMSLLVRVGIEESLVISGGIAKNVGVTTLIEKDLSLKAYISPEPQIGGAVGAALFAKEFLSKGAPV